MVPLSTHAARRSNSGYGTAIPANIIRKLLETFVLVFKVPIACGWSCKEVAEEEEIGEERKVLQKVLCRSVRNFVSCNGQCFGS